MPSADAPPCQARRLLAGVLVVAAVATAGWLLLARPNRPVTLPPPPAAAAAMAGAALSPAAPPSVEPLTAGPETAAPASTPAIASEGLPQAAVPAPPPVPPSTSPSTAPREEPTASAGDSVQGGSSAKRLRRSLAATPPVPTYFPREGQSAPPRLKEPNPSLEWFRLGVLYQQAGDHRRAIEQYRAFLAIDPRHAAALNNLAVSLRHLGELDAAADFLQRATAVDPTYDKAFTNLGVVRQLQERSDAAIEAHLRALAINGQNWESAFNLGLLFWEADDLERANQFFLKVISVRSDAPAYYHLGLIAERQGRRNEAVDRYRQALQAREGAQADLTTEAERRLRSLLGQVRR